MRKEDKNKIKKLINSKKGEMLVVAEFYYNTNECVIRKEEAIYYDSWNTVLFEKIFSTENSEFKSIKLIKSLFPSVEKVFAYYDCEDGGHLIKDTLKLKGWQVINNTRTPMYETSCCFIFSVPKNFDFGAIHEKKIDDLMIYYED